MQIQLDQKLEHQKEENMVSSTFSDIQCKYQFEPLITWEADNLFKIIKHYVSTRPEIESEYFFAVT